MNDEQNATIEHIQQVHSYMQQAIHSGNWELLTELSADMELLSQKAAKHAQVCDELGCEA